MRVLFYGTRAFALPALGALLDRHTVVAVVTEPDRPVGHGAPGIASPVKELAMARRLPVLQPARLDDLASLGELRGLDPDVAVIAAFGGMLPRSVLEIPRHGSINVHASLLPRGRGPAPVPWTIIRGEEVTGVTTFLMDEGEDSGPLLLQRPVRVEPVETAGELARRLARLGAEAVRDTLDQLDTRTAVPQDHHAATFAPPLREADGILDWTQPARDLVARIRGVNPWPSASSRSPAGRLLIWRARALPGAAEPGVVTGTGAVVAIGTGDGLLEPIEVQPENRRPMPWDTFVAGARVRPGDRLHRSTSVSAESPACRQPCPAPILQHGPDGAGVRYSAGQ